MDDPKRLVAAGYDAMATRFDEWQRQIVGSPRMRYLDKLLALLPPRADLLELGCGAGVESTRALAERGRLTGVDISEAQLALARQRIPSATFIRADLAELTFAPESFDGVVALYVLFHLPRAEVRPLIGRVSDWLRPGGVFLATMLGRGVGEGVEEWLGVPMFFSNSDPDADRELVRDAGLTILEDETIVQTEPEGDLPFHWVLAQKPKA
jgi:cyclopropane fatty-acyl-phospholipid synthase-like methyltransferase